MGDSKKLFCDVGGGEGGAYLQLSDQGSFFSNWTYIGSMCHRYLKRCRVLKTLILLGIILISGRGEGGGGVE